MAIKPITPPRGAKTRVEAKQTYIPRQRAGEPQRRTARGGRGNEMVTEDDVSARNVAQQATTTRWDRMPAALDYIRRFIDAKDYPLDDDVSRQVISLLLEGLRRHVQHIEEQARNEKKKLTPMAAMKLMDDIYRFKERVGALVKSPAEKVYDILRFTTVPEVCLDAGVSTLALDGVGRLNLLDDISVSVPKEHKEEFYQWLVEIGFEDLLTQTVNAQTLAAWTRRQLQSRDGVKLPAYVKITPVTRAQITR